MKFCKDCVYFVKEWHHLKETPESVWLNSKCSYPTVLNKVTGTPTSNCWIERSQYALWGQNMCGSQGSWYEERKLIPITVGKGPYYPESV